jgi:hypothetical protein
VQRRVQAVVAVLLIRLPPRQEMEEAAALPAAAEAVVALASTLPPTLATAVPVPVVKFGSLNTRTIRALSLAVSAMV